MSKTDYAGRLRAASERADLSAPSLEQLHERRRRRQQTKRTTAVIVGMALTIGLITGGLAAARATRHGSTGSVSGGAPIAHAPHLRPGQYLYRQQVMVSPVCRVVITTWWATNNSGRIDSKMTDPRHCDYGPPPNGVFGPGRFPWDSNTAGLSSDPSVLYTQMERRTAPGGRSPEPQFSPGPVISDGVTAGSLWDSVVNLLNDPNSGPDLYAGLYRVALEIPGVHVMKAVTDPAGRPAIAVVGRAGTPLATSYEYFDPSSAQLMAEGGPPGSANRTATYFSEGIVNSTDAVPTADQWLFPPAHLKGQPVGPSPQG